MAEDLGIHGDSVLDPSFNMNNFDCMNLPEGHPDRARAFEFALAGTMLATTQAQQLSSDRQSPRSGSRHTTSSSHSPTHQFSQAQATNDEQLLGVHAPISEFACTGPGGLCYGENGEPGFAVRKSSGSSLHKNRYWLDRNNTASMASFAAQCTSAGESVYECAKVGLRSFSPMNAQSCPADDNAYLPTLRERVCNELGEAIDDMGDFVFPTFDQLPEEFQNPTSSADYCSTIPISASGVSMADMESTANNSLAWDNEEMNFAMDMDMDLDLDLNVLGKC